MVRVKTEYISIGGNRHPAASDWSEHFSLLAFGAGNNIALWNPTTESHRGVRSILTGHTEAVNVVRFFPSGLRRPQILLTGSVDRTIRIWQSKSPSDSSFRCVLTIDAHESSINCIAVAPGAEVFASGSADGTVKIWSLKPEPEIVASLFQIIPLKPRYFPLTLALSVLSRENESSSLILAAAGTQSTVQLYVAPRNRGPAPAKGFELQATLKGHESWVRSLAFRFEKAVSTSDLLLASASQDKYIRLWRITELANEATIKSNELDASLGEVISNIAHHINDSKADYSVSFDALLLGHEDWIYTASWSPSNSTRLQLLSASADTSLAIWEPDPDSGVWVCVTRLGGISAQKGSTSATGSTGGFWAGLWSPTGSEVVSLGRAGSWRLWKSDNISEEWVQQYGVTGHVGSVTGIAWEVEGGYLLSTSSDQTTRLHAEWRRTGQRSWHEVARPQIHGYDLNCIDVLSQSKFVSGADEKLLRVFQEPRATADLLGNISGLKSTAQTLQMLPDAASMPVLGLSNKATEVTDSDAPIPNDPVNRFDDHPPHTHGRRPDIALDQPPTEDQLARHTLWPEVEKLYGHGYEISAIAASHDRSLIATACKSSSLDHAVIRLYETSEWHEIKPSLKAHSLTVTSIRFSGDDNMLLSVGRDRQWSVFRRSKEDGRNYKLVASNPKGHSRMILDASWAPSTAGDVFATAGRDKNVKIWSGIDDDFVCKTTVAAANSITAIAFDPRISEDGTLLLAVGDERGGLSLYTLAMKTLACVRSFSFRQEDCPTKVITKVAWRPKLVDPAVDVGEEEVGDSRGDVSYQLAVASEDSSLRILGLSDLLA